MNNRASSFENIYCSERGIESHNQIIESRFFAIRKIYSVLLVDSDKSNRLKLKAVLEKANFKVTYCGSHSKGLALLRNNYFDVIVTNLEIEVGDSLDYLTTLSKYRSQFPNPEMPIIVLASDQPDMEFEVIRKGADMFCDKKLAFKHIVRQIHFLLDNPLD